MKKGDYIIENIYQGGYSSLKPSYGDIFTGYRVAAGELGAPTKPDTANQIQEVNKLLNQGIIPLEVGALKPEIFDQIPKQHFKELNRMAKLTGAKLSVHAPLIEPSGMTEQGWNESNRELAERQLTDVVFKSHELDSEGNVPITIHSAGIPGKEYKVINGKKEIERLIVVNQETGKMAPIEREEKHYPGMADVRAGKILEPEKELEILNDNEWDNSLSQITFYKEGADRILSENAPQIQHLMESIDQGKFKPENLTPTQKAAYNHIINADTYLRNSLQYLTGLFNKAYKFGTEAEKEKLVEASNEFAKNLPKKYENPIQTSEALQGLINNLRRIKPQLWMPIVDFAVKHSSETFANVAFNAYDKFKDKAPQLNIENMFTGMAFAQSEEMDRLITETKNKFVKKAVEKGYSEAQAKEQADKIIGMTLDVGHLNISKKGGFKDEDLKKEVAEIAKYVKHVHLTDNFGYSDSHLPPGMGNVPFKVILEELEKKGFKGRKIVEAGGFVQHFGTSPFQHVLEAMGSPIYAMAMAPYWNQTMGLQQGYFGGYGQMLPQVNYETMGAGFSQLPAELGGQKPGAQGSRMSGKPME